MKVLHSTCQQIWKIQQWPQDWKRSVFTPIPKKGNAKECSNYHTIALISHASKVMLKILQDRLQQYVNRELSDVPAGFRKGRGTRDQIANIHWIIEKQEISRDQLSHVQLFATPWTAACQASLPIINSRNLLKLMSTKSVIRADLCSESCRDTTAAKYLLLLY